MPSSARRRNRCRFASATTATSRTSTPRAVQGIEPTVIRQPGIAMDIDHPVDLALFLRLPQSAGTRTRTLLEELGVPALLAARGIA